MEREYFKGHIMPERSDKGEFKSIVKKVEVLDQ